MILLQGQIITQLLLDANIPVEGIRVLSLGSAEIVYTKEATAQQKLDGQAILDSFDWNTPTDTRSERDKAIDAIVADYAANNPTVLTGINI